MKKGKVVGLALLTGAIILLVVAFGGHGRITDSLKELSNPTRSEKSVFEANNGEKSTTLKDSLFLARKQHALQNGDDGGTEVQKAHAREEVRHIGFLKVHKAASSTMQNMFFRFGLKRNLTFVFTEHPNYFSRSTTSHLPLVKPKFRKGYDILCNHGMFNYNIYSSLLPNDTVYLGIVRDPLEVFISAVNYYTQPSQMIAYIGKIPGNKIHNLIKYTDRYDRSTFSYTRNVMARDFGFSTKNHASAIKSRLDELDKIFKLVIIVEYFEESLILMKRYLNWTLRDILFIPNNVYSKSKGYSKTDLNPQDIDSFKQRNSLDYKVYDFFHARFWRQFNSESDDIHGEVLNFKRILDILYTYCKGLDHESQGPLKIFQTNWNEEFYLYPEDCRLMMEDELKFISVLRKAQGSELRQKLHRKRSVR